MKEEIKNIIFNMLFAIVIVVCIMFFSFKNDLKTKKYEETQIDNENELNDTINMKYPYYKKKEPRNISGSGMKLKKQFRFNRK